MDTLRDKIVVTRKRHKCNACLRYFDKGTKMRTQVNIEDGIQVWRECPTCTELLSDHRTVFEDYDNLCFEGCVADELSELDLKSPEDLLTYFNMSSK